MKKIVASLLLSLGILTAGAPKAEAIVGLAISTPAVAVVGGVVALGGGIWTASFLNGDALEALGVIMTIPVTIVGIVILDGDQAGEIAFAPVSAGSATHFSKAEIATYNKELSQLNAIQQTITKEATVNRKLDVKARWEVLGAKLSPATIEIAAFNGAELLKSLK